MRFVSTRSGAVRVGFGEAMLAGLAGDGGLFVPETFPRFDAASFSPDASMAEVGERVLWPFLEGDPLQAHLAEMCREAFDFPVPLVSLEPGLSVLELFHGPTAAFKDVGARFLAALVSRASLAGATVLVATSGDTGGAVAAAFHGKPGVRVCILFPKGRISPLQERQLTTWGGNVQALAVDGTFDDCQRLVKDALRAPGGRMLLSANSISMGRILPQVVYYARASVQHRARERAEPTFVVPSGNLGNAVAALWAKACGFPIASVVMASNANRAIVEYVEHGTRGERPTVPTLANAMDVGTPSNLERLAALLPERERLRASVRALSVSDEEIRQTIRAQAWGHVWCPHTATAVHAVKTLGLEHAVMVATAHPAKFKEVVEPLIGRVVPLPPQLEAIARKTAVAEALEPALDALLRRL